MINMPTDDHINCWRRSLRWIVIMVLGHKLFDSEATSWNRTTAERKFVFCWQTGRTRQRWYDPAKEESHGHLHRIHTPSHRALNGADGRSTQARTQLEREGWQSEVEGLCDALLNKRSHEQVSALSAQCVREVCEWFRGWARDYAHYVR